MGPRLPARSHDPTGARRLLSLRRLLQLLNEVVREPLFECVAVYRHGRELAAEEGGSSLQALLSEPVLLVVVARIGRHRVGVREYEDEKKSKRYEVALTLFRTWPDSRFVEVIHELWVKTLLMDSVTPIINDSF
jgi:hypothetical protein